MDHIIRDAAEKHHPAYNDKAWEKMEKKLDAHLPQKDDRRKFIFFLLFFLLLGGGTIFSIIYFTGNKTPVNKEIADNSGIKKPAQESAEQLDPSPLLKKEDISVPQDKDVVMQPVVSPGNSDRLTDNPVPEENKEKTAKNGKGSSKIIKGKSAISIVGATASDEYTKEENEKSAKKRPGKKDTNARKNVVITSANPVNEETNEVTAAPVIAASDTRQTDLTDEQNKETVKADDEKKEDVPAKKEDLATISKPQDKKKSKKNFANNFGITVSAGTDLSFIELNKLGKATFTYGVGLSYDFAKRFTVRTGFYFAKKIYTATPDQYHTPGGNYPNLYEVAADCKVYEIPVSISYNFGQKGNHNWFGGAGLSSFLMKKEYYDYQYKTASGQTYNYARTVKNENNHYFAVLTLSGGYKYNFNKMISLQAEPYVKIPLGGIGLGKINLKSSGILLTLTVKPFAKRK